MQQYTLEDFSSSGVQCPICDKQCESYKGYAIHHSRLGGHSGEPLLDLVGEDRFRHLYWTLSHEELAEELGVGTSTLETSIDSLDLEGRTKENRLEYKYGVPLDWLLDTLHNTLKKSALQMSKDLGVSRRQIERWMDAEYDIPRRGMAEAEELKWRQMTDEERERQVQAAHQKTRELVEKGEHPFQEWWVNNPEEAREHAKQVAALGADGREKNGMEGVTGQDHPNWRGGKSIYDALKKQLKPSFDSVKDGYRDTECYKCGASGCKLDVHHIVPIMAGGTNEEWNMMTLCESCHIKAEWYTRDIIEPVLIE